MVIDVDALHFAKQRAPQADLIQMDARHIPFVREFDVIGMFIDLPVGGSLLIIAKKPR